MHKKFSDLEELKKNDWKVEQKVKRTTAKKKTIEVFMSQLQLVPYGLEVTT